MSGSGSATFATERLVLRPHTAGDLQASLSLWTNQGVVRFIGGRPSTPDEVWGRMLRYAGLWALLGFGYWLAERRDDGQFVGELGFARFARGLGADFDEAVEAGWAFLPVARGQGLAHEAMSAALAWLGQHHPGARTVCLIQADNEASIRLARRLGFCRYRSAPYKDAVSELFERAHASNQSEIHGR